MSRTKSVISLLSLQDNFSKSSFQDILNLSLNSSKGESHTHVESESKKHYYGDKILSCMKSCIDDHGSFIQEDIQKFWGIEPKNRSFQRSFKCHWEDDKFDGTGGISLVHKCNF